jgi:hypothetical protein
MDDDPTNESLESALDLPGDSEAKDELVRERLEEGDVLVLGHSKDGQQLADLLYFKAGDRKGSQIEVVPAFTRLGFLQRAVRKNPDWEPFDILKVNGRDLLEAVDAAAIIINPWGNLEYRLPLRQLQTA